MIEYIKIIKPGIVIANMISVFSGFCYSQLSINFNLLFFVLLGSILLISSGCILNNIIDVDIDRKMSRTKHRLTTKVGFFFKLFFFLTGVLFFCISILIFFLKVNILCVFLSCIGFFFYVILYSLFLKRQSIYSVFFGGIAGALPPVIGYCSTKNSFDIKSILLFLIFFVWQIPHSYSILLIYQKDYNIAQIPNIVSEKGISYTVFSILFYILFFFILIVTFYKFYFTKSFLFILLFFFTIIWIVVSLFTLFSKIKINYFKYLFYCSVFIILIFDVCLIFS
ncbi:protoheme IX farnesyltransferase [Buchnera aphidicola]|uniref:protoheme IX farnesyltransferase n=1 Tax=Buchnera aphidicola TaxID=9 RepID=UPI0031B81177